MKIIFNILLLTQTQVLVPNCQPTMRSAGLLPHFRRMSFERVQEAAEPAEPGGRRRRSLARKLQETFAEGLEGLGDGNVWGSRYLK